MGFFRFFLYFFLGLFLYNKIIGLPSPSYTFKVKVIKDIARKNSGHQFSASNLKKELAQLYPDYVFNNDVEWLPSNTGGLHGSVSVLYASITEILVLYHNEMETRGNSGRHFMNVSSTVLQGKMEYSTDAGHLRAPGSINPGENHVFRSGTSSEVKLSAGTTLLIYCRGFVPLTFGYWISESLFVQHDPLLVITTIWVYLKAVAMSNATVWKAAQKFFLYLWKLSSNGIEYLWESVHYGITHFSEAMSRVFAWIQSVFSNLLH